MHKLILLIIILTLQTFPTYGTLKAKYLYCETIESSYKIEPDKWIKEKLSERSFLDKIMDILGISFGKYKLTEYMISDNNEGNLQISDVAYKYRTYDKSIDWTLSDRPNDSGRHVHYSKLDRENLILRNIFKTFDKSEKLTYISIDIFQCSIKTRPKLFNKLRQKLDEFKKIRREKRKNNKI